MAESSGSVVSNNVNTQKQSSVVQSTDSADEDKTDKVMEPMLLEDFKYKEEPRSLLNLFEFFTSNNLKPNKTDILAGLIYILMLESGFVPSEHKDCLGSYAFNYQRVLRFSKQLPKDWKKGNMYSFSFVLPQLLNYKCKVACVLAADDILVNCMVMGIENGNFNIILDPLMYFISSSTDIRCDKLQNLGFLSRLVKDEVCCPAKRVILEEFKIIDCCMETLPPEIVVFIMKFLRVKDFLRLGQTNSFFNTLTKTPKLWQNRLKLDFGVVNPTNCYEALRDSYKQLHRLKYSAKNDNVRYRYIACPIYLKSGVSLQ